MSIIQCIREQLSQEGYSKHARGIKNNKGEIEIEKYKWNFLMACLNRMGEIGNYLNSAEMQIEFGKKFVEFKFIELLNYSCQIERITNQIIMNVSEEEFTDNEPNKFFALDDFRRKYGKNNLGDSQFVEYIRSLCAIHPTETNRHKGKGFQSGLEFSPYVSPTGKIHSIMKFPQVINSSSTTDELSNCMSITVYPGERSISGIQTSNMIEMEYLLERGEIDQEEFDILKDQSYFGNDYNIIVNVKDLICFTEDRFARLEVLI
ncbi:hypothetical protein ABEX00_02630 [Bacillus safensis]